MNISRIHKKRKCFPRTWQHIALTLLLGILMLGWAIPTPLATSDHYNSDSSSDFPQLDDRKVISSVGSTGNDIDSVMIYSREIQGLDLELMNSFSDTTSHSETIDFSSYHIDGWSLYEVQISTSKVVALLEHEFTQSNSNPNFTEFTIREHSEGEYYDQLAQGFYDMSHDGQLQNISLLYVCPNYDPANHDYAYMDIRSDYTDGSTNMVSSVQLENVGLTPTWANVTESVVLDADTVYYTVMNGTELVDVGSYPQIIWFYVDGAGSFTSRRHNTGGDTWGSDRPLEALLNYTYIPWNTTSDSALEFQNPMSVALQGNSSSLTGSEWIFSSMSNVSQVHFSSNQSISIEYDLTLRYKQNNTSTASWYAGVSGADVAWNVTSILDFPELSGSQDKNLTLELPDDWTANHLFNITNPTEYYDHFNQDGSSVECSLLADETWILECISPNYIQSLSKFDTSDDSTINYKVSVSVTMDINATIESALSDPATNGKASLRVFYQDAVEYAENYTVTAGKSYHQWDISTDSSSNGLHTIDLYWTNGTEVGYLTSDVLVYYETTLVADEYTIDAFTDDTFYIGIDFNQIFPAGGIDASAADVSYSFGSVVNQSLDDKSNGRWDATVSTASMTPDTHTLTVYAEGYALENRSITIDVTLIHDTNILTIQWLDSNNISFIDTTELRVEYTRVGDIPVADALVNVTIDGEIIPLTWDSDLSLYRLTFNGTDTYSGFDTYDLTINAWKVGHKAQTDTSQNLTIHHEYTNFAINWSHGTDITYIEYTILIVSYQMSDSSAIPIANVNVTDDITTWPLHWNETDGTYWIKFNGTDSNPGYGTHNLTIQASKFGYESHENTSYSLMVSKVPTSLELSWSNGNTISYVQTTTLVMNYTMLDGSPIVDAIVNVTIGVDFWTIDYDSETRTYNLILNGSDIDPGLGNYPLVVLADLIGYDGKLNDTYSFTIDLESTTMLVSWSAGSDISYVQTTILNVTYLMSNSSPVEGAVVNVTINGHVWNMTWDDSTSYLLVFNGSDTIPGFGIHNLTIIASRFGYESRSNITETLDVHEESTIFDIEWSGSTIITYVGSVILYVDYQMSNTDAIPNATVIVTIGTDVFEMHYTSNRYWHQFNGNDLLPGFGNHTLTIEVNKFGYQNQSNLVQTLNITEEPTTLVLTWSNTNSITYINSTTLIANFTQSSGAPVIDATVNVSVGTGFWPMKWNNQTFVYELTFNGTDLIPGFGTYNVTVLAGDTGFVDRSNSNEDLIVSLESTSITITWSNTDNITYIEQTTLIVSYRMSNDSVIPVDATINVTIGETRWDLGWDSDTDTYRLVFNGTDIPPGIDTHNLTIRIGKYGYFNHVNSTITLTITEVPTSQHVYWSNTNSITYTQSTTLTVNYTMTDGSPVTNAIVNVSTGIGFWPMKWNDVTFVYELTFNGTDSILGFGTHSLTIRIGKFGYSNPGNLTETITLDEEPTTMVITWSNTNSITFIGSTVLIINYTMTDGTPVTDATVNVTIGVKPWELVWDAGSETYQVEFLGSDISPGFGTHNLTIRADKFGYVNHVNSTENLILSEEPTSLVILWSNTENITYLESTILSVSYRMSDETPISDATLTMTIGVEPLPLEWHEGTQTYQYVFTGVGAFPGFGIHNLTIEANKTGYETLNETEILRISEVPTTIVITWSNTNNITFIESTILSVNYTKTDGSPVTGALVNATVGEKRWTLTWDIDSKTYLVEIFGSDEPPGFGTYNITIIAEKFGYVSHTNDSQSLTLEREPTSLVVSWIPDSDITYQTSSILVVSYRMNDSTPISGAIVNVTIGGGFWPLVWSAVDQDYRLQIYGTDVPPGLGTYTMNIQASKKGFDAASNLTAQVTLREEPTMNLVVQWANGENNPGFFSYTYLIVDYLYGGTLPVLNAVLVVSINSYTFEMEWNVTEDYYQLRINGSDSYLGVDTNSITIDAGKYGYVNQTDSTEVIIPVIPTILELSWSPFDMITYVEHTTLRANYSMFNGTSVLGASVNVTINGITLPLTWSSSSESYERTFYGSDSTLGVTTNFSILVEALMDDFQGQSNSDERLFIQTEPTSLLISWIGGDNITYFSQTTLSVQFIMSNDTPISTGTLNATINGSLWNLNYNILTEAYEVTIFGNDALLDYYSYNVTINASGYGYVSLVDSSETLTIRLEDTYLTFEWVPINTISYLDSTIFRIYYRYSSNNSPVVGANVNATYAITWIAIYNESSKAYEIVFTGSDLLNTTDSPYTLDVYASKNNHFPFHDNSQNLTVVREDTLIEPFWLNDDNTISFVESTTIYINYSIASSGASIVNASMTVRIGAKTWPTVYNNTLELYAFTFTGDMNPPGLGTFTLYISATYVDHDGFKDASNNTMTLEILSESVNIHSYWIGGNTITYVDYTILVVNYTMSNGSAIPEATVNVTIGSSYWILPWHNSSQTYQMIFNGSDSPPNLGYHELNIRANKDGFVTLTSTLSLEIIVEPSTVASHWSDPYQNNITYFEYTYLFVEYSMSNGSPIFNASVSVAIGLDSWMLEWNSTAQAYGIRFNGSDVPPGFGNHSLMIDASKFGYAVAGNLTSLEINKDPTSIDVIWSNGNDISFVENTTLMVYYRMSNNTPILTGIVEASIGDESWTLTWNESAQAYCYTFNGTMNPPGIDRFTIEITTVGDIFASQYNTTEFEIHEETTSVIPSWTTETMNWTESLVLFVEYRDSYGRLIAGATQKVITIDSVPYTLSGSDGTYWFEFNNTFDVRLHLVEINISKYGYEFSSNTGISIDIIEAPTNLELLWNTETIDYLGQIELFANYSCNGSTVPYGDVVANITIDGSDDLPLEFSGEYWVINLTGVFLDLGPHSITIKAQAYGYNFAEITHIFTVDEVVTDALSVSWDPSNVTIEFTESIQLVVDYTFYGGDVPDNASVDVTINSQVYNLDYSSGAWRVTINGSEINIGLYDASISASLHGYALQTNITIGVNVTAAANWFHVLWEPSDLVATYIDTINISVIYTQDFEPIDGASVYLTLNGTLYELVYSPFDERWHVTISASSIGLGIWNATLTANKTGYADGWDSEYLAIMNANTTLDVNILTPSVYYDESVDFDIFYLMSNLSFVPDGVLTVSLEGIEQTFSWDSDHWTRTFEGAELGIGEHNFTVTVSAFGFEERTESILIAVLPIPTEIVYDDVTVVSALEIFSLRFTYLDTRTDTGIVGAIANIDWMDTSNLLDLGNGTYVVEIGGSSLHIGNYTLEITLVRIGYVDRSGTVDIEVNSILTDLLAMTHITQYENETITIETKFIDSTSSDPIIGATVVASLEGVDYLLVYDSETGNYSLTIRLPHNMNPDSYSISISAEANDYESGDALIELNVLAKSTCTLSLDVAEQTQSGEELVITITVLVDSLPVGDISLTLYITISTESGSRIHTQEITTNENGIVTVTFEVPSDATNLEITAKYAGSISRWSAESTVHNVEITSGGGGFLNTFLRDPVMLSIVIGGISLPLIALAFRRRRIGGGRVSAPVSVAPVAPVTPPASPLSEMHKKIRDEIVNSEEGVTRAELSRRLGPSASKIGAMVKDLLNSDSGFYEVREGAKKLIKFRNPD